MIRENRFLNLRSWLFAPASNPKLLYSSVVYKPDAIIFDLEDAVALKEKEDARELLSVEFSLGNNGKKIAITVVNSIFYAILFNIIGYVFSTIIFLEIELLIFGGIKALKISTIVAIVFSIIAYLIFNVFLGIYLPKSPLGII